MYIKTVLVLFLIATLHTVSVNSLRCWKCSSENDVTCRDFFNVTRIRENRRYQENVNYSNRQQVVQTEPHVEVCDEMYTYHQQKNVCLKRVSTSSTGIKTVNRECRLVPRNLRPGQCPEDLGTGHRFSNDYCGTCDYDECNSSIIYKSSAILTLLPAITAFYCLLL